MPLALDNVADSRTTYALSKMFGESVCHNYGRKYHIPYTIVRFHNVYGPRMGFAHVIPELFIKIARQNKVDLPSARHTRAFCYISDATEMIIRLCTDPAADGELYHVGSSHQEISIAELGKMIAGVMNKTPQWRYLPPTTGSPERRCPDISKVVKQTGYEPQISLLAGIQSTYDWYKDRLDKPYE